MRSFALESLAMLAYFPPTETLNENEVLNGIFVVVVCPLCYIYIGTSIYKYIHMLQSIFALICPFLAKTHSTQQCFQLIALPSVSMFFNRKVALGGRRPATPEVSIGRSSTDVAMT